MHADQRLTTLLRNFGDRDMTTSDHHQGGYVFPDNQIAFVHLPKTGGSTMHRYLSFCSSHLHRWVNITSEGLHRPVSRRCPPGRYRYFTIMRDPVERVWSYYQMLIRNGKRYPWHGYAALSLHEFLSHCWEVRNMAVRYVSGFVLDEPDLNTLEIASRNLSRFQAVIDFGSFDQQLASFCESLQIPVKAEDVPHCNASSYEPPSQQDIALIRSFNALDQRLYVNWQKGGLHAL